MPTYEYVCDTENGGCGHEFEEFQTITEEALKQCPKCNKEKLRRLFGVGARIIFKGDGWTQKD